MLRFYVSLLLTYEYFTVRFRLGFFFFKVYGKKNEDPGQ